MQKLHVVFFVQNSNTSLMHKASEAYRPNQAALGDEQKVKNH